MLTKLKNLWNKLQQFLRDREEWEIKDRKRRIKSLKSRESLLKQEIKVKRLERKMSKEDQKRSPNVFETDGDMTKYFLIL